MNSGSEQKKVSSSGTKATRSAMPVDEAGVGEIDTMHIGGGHRIVTCRLADLGEDIFFSICGHPAEMVFFLIDSKDVALEASTDRGELERIRRSLKK